MLVCRDERLWNELVFHSKLTLPDHFWHLADIHYILSEGDNYILLPFVNRNFMGFKALLSYGLRMSGGPAPLKRYSLNSYLDSIYKALLQLIEDGDNDVVNITVKLYGNDFYISLAKGLLYRFSKCDDLRVLTHLLKARVIFVGGKSYDYLWRSVYNKKVRNAVRKFIKCGGKVEILEEPLSYIKDILLCNLSSPRRQGRPLPPSYTNPRLVYEGLKLYVNKYMKYGKFYVYGAFLNDELVGYSYVLLHNHHAYISRFIVNLNYRRCCVGEGLLDGVLRDLIRLGSVREVQYAYWSPISAPGVDHFLRQFGFTVGKELAIFIFKKSVLFEHFLKFLFRVRTYGFEKGGFLKYKRLYLAIRPLKNLLMKFLI